VKQYRPDSILCSSRYDNIAVWWQMSTATAAASDATVAASGRPENNRESHKKHLISSVLTPIDPKFCGQAPKVVKMLLHENHSLTCLTTSGIEGSWFETKKRTPKMKIARSKCSSRFSSNPSVKIFLRSHSTSRNKRFAKRSTTQRDRTTGRKVKT
jgi:hypothetical protein